MKIVLLGTTVGCTLGFRADLIKDLVAKGVDVYAFALDYDECSRQSVTELGAIPVAYTFSRTGLNPVGDILNTYKLARKLKEISPDLVFSYFSKPVIFGTIAAVLAGVKRRVAMLEGLGFVFTEPPSGVSKKLKILKWFQINLYRISFYFLEMVIFLNPDDPIDLVEKYRIKVKKVSVLGGIGLKLEDYPYSEPNINPISFIFIGRLLAEKGVNEYICAARLVKERYPKAQFIILGGLDDDNPGGISEHELETLVDEDIVIYPGHVSNVLDWLTESSVFVLPSYYREGVPRSTQEAMAVGRAVITTDSPGCRETVVDGLNGFLVPPWAAEDLAEKMIYFIENPESIEKMGLESYRIAQENFDAVKVNKKLISYLLTAG